MLWFSALSQRARSTSRKRPLDEERHEMNPSLASVLSSSYPGRSSISAHSSPASANSHPSPPSTVLEHPLESSPHMMSANSFGMAQSPTIGIPPGHFEYDFALSQSPPNDGRWNGQNDSMGSGSNNVNMGYANNSGFSPTNPTIDTSYLQFGGGPDMNVDVTGGLSTTPPSATFAGPGLPFRGLDYIRNYNNPGPSSNGYSMGGNDIYQDALWQTFDPGAFGLDPEVPFSFGDFTVDEQDNSQQQQQ